MLKHMTFLGSVVLLIAVPVALLVTTAIPAADLPAPAKLWVGTAWVDITPPLPVALTGFQTVRMATKQVTPLTANVLALESRDGDRVVDQSILVSCDLLEIRDGLAEALRERVASRLPGFDVEKLVVTATHTHSSPVLEQDAYQESTYGQAMQPKDYRPFLLERLADVVVKAWESRAVSSVGWGLGHAVLGHNRRLVYADGHAAMLSSADDPNFRQPEGYEDHGVDILTFYDEKGQLKATALSVACSAQMSQGDTVVSADFWHYTRELLRQRYGQELGVIGFCAPAGDQCPHLSYRKKGEARMDRLRGLTRTEELGRRLAEAFFDVADVIAKDVHREVPMRHLAEQIELPERIVTAEEYATAKKVCDDIDAKPEMSGWDYWVRRLYHRIVTRYEAQQKGERTFAVELHVLRLGEVAIATNPFELFLDYGLRMEARSHAEQTFLIQLASTREPYPGYLPTERAVAGGSLTTAAMNNYSATIMSNLVGPEGGQVLVDRTVEAINSLWPAPAKKK